VVVTPSGLVTPQQKLVSRVLGLLAMFQVLLVVKVLLNKRLRHLDTLTLLF
jgi:hypothetical protein